LADTTKIPWTDKTFNPWRGCQKVSAGCAHCYAEALSRRNPAVLGTWGPGGKRPVAAEDYWRLPLRWNEEARTKGRRLRVFCASLADVFEGRPDLDAPRRRLWELVRATPRLDWQLLTHRPERMADYLPPDWGDGYPNVWLGVTIEGDDYCGRADLLRRLPAVVRFVSAEPLLGPLPSLDLAGIDWLIVGGESGRDFRPMDHAWARQLLAKARAADVAFFFKQSAARRPDTGIELDGRLVREFPGVPLPVVAAGGALP
jgi:protein gp37